MRTDLAQVRAILEAAAGRTADLLHSIPDGDLPVKRSDWTVGEVGAHLVIVLRGLAQAVEGSFDAVSPFIPDTELFRDRLTAVTAGTLERFPEREPRVLAKLVLDGAQTFLTTTAGRASDEVVRAPWYGPRASLSMAGATCLLAGEQIIHGYDIAQTVGHRWPISTADALAVLPLEMIPLAVNPATARGHTANYEVHARGGPRFVVRFSDGVATVEPAGGQTVDCRLSADPVDLMLVVYGRISQWGPIAHGRLMAWGRKPWLGLKFKDLFFNP